jgi:hypothetical protein
MMTNARHMMSLRQKPAESYADIEDRRTLCTLAPAKGGRSFSGHDHASARFAPDLPGDDRAAVRPAPLRAA